MLSSDVIFEKDTGIKAMRNRFGELTGFTISNPGQYRVEASNTDRQLYLYKNNELVGSVKQSVELIIVDTFPGFDLSNDKSKPKAIHKYELKKLKDRLSARGKSIYGPQRSR